jgi:hypothetical protein
MVSGQPAAGSAPGRPGPAVAGASREKESGCERPGADSAALLLLAFLEQLLQHVVDV